MGIKMNNAPVYFTMAQVQFNPILNLENYLPSIQSKMREIHFPDYSREVVQEMTFPFAATTGIQIAPSVTNQARFRFGDIDGWQSFLLTQNQLSFQTTRYDTFETFLNCIASGLTILNEIMKLDFVERLGLRYLDAVQPNANESLAAYLAPEVLGLSQKTSGQLAHSISETFTQTKVGYLMARIVIRNGQLGLPIELATQKIKLNPKFLTQNEQHAIIDTDAFLEQRQAFNVTQIEADLTSLHDEIKSAFTTTVTDHAQTIWA